MPTNLIETLFPNLQAGGYAVTSQRTAEYNCIAWAAGDMGQWWEPMGDHHYWPDSATNEYSLIAFAQAFAAHGYARCDDAALEAGFEKMAIYVDAERMPSHAARQLPSGKWTSKLSKLEDIEHDTLAALEGDAYGTVALIMRKSRT